MGRMAPDVRLARHVRREVDLTTAVEAAVARARATRDADTAATPDEVLAELDGSLLEEASAGPDRGIPFPVVLLDGVEVTQAVQAPDHSVPLVAGKTTIVRVYLSYPEAVSVRGELHLARSAGGPWQTVPSLGAAQLEPGSTGGSLPQLASRRRDLALSLNFQVPAELTAAGDLWVQMGPILRETGTPLPSLAGLTTQTVTFQHTAPLRLHLVRLRYTMGSPPRTHEPSATDVDLMASWLRRAYPIARLDLTTTSTVAAPFPPFENGAALINAQLIALRAVDVVTGTDARTHYYGMVANSGFFMRGLASDVPRTPRPGTVASGPAGPDTFGWDFDGSFGDWYGGHELAHTFGRFHAEFCGAQLGAPYPFPDGRLSDADERFAGIDVGDPALGLPMRVLPGTSWHDVMTYCDNQWLSSFTYQGVLDRLLAEDALSAERQGQAGAGFALAAGNTSGAEAPTMRLIAALNVTRASGSITAVLPMGGGAQAATAGQEEPPDVRIRIRDAEGATLDERPAAFMRSACQAPDDDVTGVVDMDVPAPAGAASVEVLLDGQVVDSQAIGGAPAPVGELIRADRRAAGPGGAPATVELRWEAPGASVGQRYIVQVSDDSGATWRTVAVGVAEPAVSLARDDLAGEEVLVRIMATTGSGGTTTVRTDTVRLR